MSWPGVTSENGRIDWARTMEPAVGELLNSPKLALPVERFGRILEEEQNKRDRFYDEANLREVQRIVQEE